jgi:hypothetical protein
MKTFSAGKPLDRTTARNCFLINQFATPGLGSLMARRYVAGAGQLLLALIGFGLVVAWFISVMSRLYQQVEGGSSSGSAGWLGEAGAVAFAASWLWSLVTSLSLLREAREKERHVPPPHSLT